MHLLNPKLGHSCSSHYALIFWLIGCDNIGHSEDAIQWFLKKKLDRLHADYMVQGFHTHIYVSVNCTGLEMLVLACWSMARLLIVKSAGSTP